MSTTQQNELTERELWEQRYRDEIAKNKQAELAGQVDPIMERAGMYLQETPPWLQEGLKQQLGMLQQRASGQGPSLAGLQATGKAQGLVQGAQQAAAGGRPNMGPGLMQAAMKQGLGGFGQLGQKSSQAAAAERLQAIKGLQGAQQQAFGSLMAPQLALAESVARQYAAEKGMKEQPANWEKITGGIASAMPFL